MKFWYIYGAGGLGAETMNILTHAQKSYGFNNIQPAFLVDKPTETKILGYPVFSFEETKPGSSVTIAVGEPEIRYQLRKKAQQTGLNLASIISPSAFISPQADISDGVIIAPFCSIQARARVGENVAVNTATIIGHDVVVDADAALSSMVNLGGSTQVGSRSYIGMGAMVKEGLSIGHSTIVGMGSVVYTDVPDEVICVGNPARVSRRNKEKRVFK